MANVSKYSQEKAARNAIFDQFLIRWHEQVLQKDEGQNYSPQEGKKKKSPELVYNKWTYIVMMVNLRELSSNQ